MASDQAADERLKAALADRYEIQREIGVGGMATVYLAEDLKHRRQVAVKVLRADLAATLGPDRFQREIEIAAQLQHPNILPLYDSGEADGFLFYVMPYVDGPSLRERLDKEGELPVQEVVRILRDVADALSEAHGKGVVHRDIKPANILLRGRHALVADFGVAKAVSEATGRQRLTTMGVALGTPSYMAPEQASADPHLDHRVDVYALGAVAYEMLTGRPVFMGTSAQAVLAAQMTETPKPVRELRDTVPVALEQMVLRCLEKKPADRWQRAEDLLPVLEALATPSGGVTPTAAVRVPAPARGLGKLAWPVLAVAALAVAGIALLSRPEPSLEVEFGRAVQVTTDPGLEIHPTLSPDGNLLAYASGRANRMQVFIRALGGGRTFPLTDDTAAVQTNPKWSPDGSQILFLSRGSIHVAPALGGTSRDILPARDRGGVATADWSPDGEQVAFERGDSLHVLDLRSEEVRSLGATGGVELHSCSWSPTGEAIACVHGNSGYAEVGPTFGNLAPSRVFLFLVEGGEPLAVTAGDFTDQSPAWGPDGHTLYFVSNCQGPRDVYAIQVEDGRPVGGEPRRVTLGLQAHTMAFARGGGALAYSVLDARANIWSLPIPAQGIVDPEDAVQVTQGNQVVESVRVSWDGRWLLFDSNLRGNADLYRIPLGGGEVEQLTWAPVEEFAPDLSPDGREVVFHTWETGTRDIALQRLGARAAQLLTLSDGEESFPTWSPDGSRIAFFFQGSEGAPVYLLERDPGGDWSDPIHVADSLQRPSWSPDGRYLVGAWTPERGVGILDPEAGSIRVAYQPRPASEDPLVYHPVWGRDGRTIYFRSYGPGRVPELWSVPASGGEPRLLIRFDDPLRPSVRPDFAVSETHIYFTVQDRQSDLWVMEVVEGARHE